MSSSFPDYDSIPPVRGMPDGCAWGIFDKNGEKDVYGCLNKITPECITTAAAGVRDGVSISLNWSMGAVKHPSVYRKGLTHKIVSFMDIPLGIHGFDDEVEFNTQCSSQWDSLCHFPYQPTNTGYNGANPSTEDLVQDFGYEDKTHAIPTINHWHDRGGLVGRGVLIDYKAFADRHGITYSPFETHKITVADIEAIAKEQSVVFKQGDIIIIRSGFVEELNGISAEEQDAKLSTHKAIGVEGTIDVVRWFWNQHFAAAAGDMPGFEVLPAVKDGVDGAGGPADLVLHQHFLSLLGLHIGELWDLKALSQYCAKTGRYTFMLTSVPLNIAGSVGSPPNALAIF